MVGYFINMTLAAIVSGGSYLMKWWFPAVILPAWIFCTRITPLSKDKITLGRVCNAMVFLHTRNGLYDCTSRDIPSAHGVVVRMDDRSLHRLFSRWHSRRKVGTLAYA